MTSHDPRVTPYNLVADGFIIVWCDCGCGLFEAYLARDRADRARTTAADV